MRVKGRGICGWDSRRRLITGVLRVISRGLCYSTRRILEFAGSDFRVLLRGGGDPSDAPVKWGLGLEYNAKETVTQVSTKDLVVYLCFTAHHSHDDLHSSSGKELMGTYRSYKEIQWSPPFGEGKLRQPRNGLRKRTHTGSLKQEHIKIVSKYHKGRLQVMQ